MMSYVHHQPEQHHEQHHGEDDGPNNDARHITATYEVEMDEGTGTTKQIITAEIIPQPSDQQTEQATVMTLDHNSQSTTLDESGVTSRNGEGAKDSRSHDQEDDIIGDISYGERSLMRDGRPHKYPALKQYYEFGAWVGRNRKAICVSCRHQSASSQPERLIRHLKRCPQLSDHDRSIADDLLAETMANKKTPGRPPGSGYKRDRSYNESHNSYSAGDMGSGDEHNNTSATNNNESAAESGAPMSVKSTTKRQKVFADTRNRIDEALTRFIMVNRIPLKSISSKEFVEFVRLLNPDYRIPTQGHITNVLIPGLLNII